MSYIRIDVDLSNIYDEMDRNDKQVITEWLYEDGIIQSHSNPEIRRLVRGDEESNPEIRRLVRGDEESNGEKELRDALTKLWNSYYRLSNEDEILIKQITNKL
jgi:hypothetical protein